MFRKSGDPEPTFESSAITPEVIVQNEGPLRDYLSDAFKGATGQITKQGDVATISYSPNSLLSFKGSNKYLRQNQARLETDYSFAQIERVYEKEGLIRKFVATAAAKFSRAGFKIVTNPLYKGKGAETWLDKVVAEHNAILKRSGYTWGEVIQTIGKEVHQFGNSIILKRRGADGKQINKIILDDLFFYDVIVSMPDLAIENYVRRPYTRPKPHSEDLYNLAFQAMNLNSRMANSGMGFRGASEMAGFYGPGFFGINLANGTAEETLMTKDVVHFKYIMEKNAPFSMPPIMAMVNDINDLRVLEENMVALGFQYGHPLLHVSVDLTGLNEIDARRQLNEAVASVNDMLSIGALVTSKRVEPKLHYPNGTAIPLDKFLEYLNGRIEKELDSSGLLMGNGSGAGRQAGETIEAAANDIFQMLVDLCCEKLERDYLMDIFISLGGEGEICPVQLEVEEIDRGRKASRVSTITNGMNLGAVTRDEWRTEVSLSPLTDAQKKDIKETLELKAGPGAGFKTANPTNQHGETTPGTVKD